MATLNDIDFSSLVSEPVKRISRFPDVHSGQASDVWLVETKRKAWIVRSSRLRCIPDLDFWVGCHHLFGVNPSDTDLSVIHASLKPLSKIPIPVIEKKVIQQGRTFFVVERLPGAVLRSFHALSGHAVRTLGESMACFHRASKPTFGRLDGRTAYPAEAFPQRLIDTMELLVRVYYAEDKRIAERLPQMRDMASGYR